MDEERERDAAMREPEAERQTLAALVNEVTALRGLIEARARQTWVRNGRQEDTQARDWEEAAVDLKRELAERFAAVEAQLKGWERGRRHQATEHAVTRALATSRGPAAAALGCLRELCAALGWEAGVCWRVDRQAGLLRCTAFWQSPSLEVPGVEARARARVFRRGEGLPGRVWASGLPAWQARTTDAELAQAGLRAAYGFPLGGPEEVGILEFFTQSVLPPNEDDLQMLVSVGCQLSEFIKRSEAEAALGRQADERLLARAIQQGFLPRAAPLLVGFSLAGASHPAEVVGGDYYDFVPTPRGHLLIVGDVSGHGVGAALMMGQVRACLRALALTLEDLGAILALCNRRLAEDVSSDLFATLFLARLDPDTCILHYSSAGHWPGYVLDARGGVRAVLSSTGPPLGVDPLADFPAAPPVALSAGELVLLLSDGVVEAFSPSGEPFGSARALAAVAARHREAPAAILEALFLAVRQHCHDAPADDMTAVVLRVE